MRRIIASLLLGILPGCSSQTPTAKDQPGKIQPTQDQTSTSRHPRFTTPEDVVKAYLAAATWEERLPFVVNPDSVRPQMAARYKNIDLTTTDEEFRPGTDQRQLKIPPSDN